jgi:hypothetical protein
MDGRRFGLFVHGGRTDMLNRPATCYGVCTACARCANITRRTPDYYGRLKAGHAYAANFIRFAVCPRSSLFNIPYHPSSYVMNIFQYIQAYVYLLYYPIRDVRVDGS